MTRKQIVVIQPQLASLDGHEHTQITALEWLLPQHALTVVTWQGCALADHFGGAKLLQLLPQKDRKRAAGRHDWLGFHAALKRALEITGATGTDLLLVPSAGPDELVALVSFFRHEDADTRPPAKLRILSEDVVSRLDENTRKGLLQLCETGRLVLYTETAELCKRLRDHHRLPVQGVFNLPCTIFPGSVATGMQNPSMGEEVRVGILGRQRSEKGSYWIPSILRQLRHLAVRDIHSKRICLVYQAVRSKRFRRLLLEARTRFSTRGGTEVHILFLDSGMPGPEFRQLLRDMDILLLPYDTGRYRYSGSGLIMDGVAAQKPIVHSRGMAMQELLVHGNAEAAGSDHEFAEKLLTVAKHLYRYRQGARDACSHLQVLLEESVHRLVGERPNSAG